MDTDLGDFEGEHVIWLELQLASTLAALCFEHVVNRTGYQLKRAWEEIIQQAQEDARVIRGELAQIEVSKSSQQDLKHDSMISTLTTFWENYEREIQVFELWGSGLHLILSEFWSVTLHASSNVEGGLDRPQLPIIMTCLGQHILAQLVKNNKLSTKKLRHLEALSHEHNFTNEGQVGQHHRNGPEQGLERLWQFSATRVTWIHGNKRHDCGKQFDLYLYTTRACLPVTLVAIS